MDTIQILQGALAPILLISAVGLLLLGLGNRIGRIIDRIRKFSEEVRRGEVGEERMRIIQVQKSTLVKRLKLCRNAMLYYYLAILFTSISSIMSFAQFFNHVFGYLAVWALAFALSALFIGIIYALYEVIFTYTAVLKEASFYLDENR
ncbi:Protein of unknown function (DUF2721) [Aciduliprofundum sp. MAR08-339]|uniref:DUF2721 domain-containing protein n=1 Tax=Aciduliprofundum sp. (strain MAR08-339) TaxID=673860 RepID=UPI0002A49C8C|nr:Protein of unknown function (DUF2721) [Aciduliprofundum sp. MAR08-339]